MNKVGKFSILQPIPSASTMHQRKTVFYLLIHDLWTLFTFSPPPPPHSLSDPESTDTTLTSPPLKSTPVLRNFECVLGVGPSPLSPIQCWYGTIQPSHQLVTRKAGVQARTNHHPQVDTASCHGPSRHGGC